ncbi:MAG: transposase [Azovibrio sp.]
MQVSVGHYTFNSGEQMASYIGVVLIQRTSGTSVYSRPIMLKTGPSKTRAILYISAVGAVMQKLVHLYYGIVKIRFIANLLTRKTVFISSSALLSCPVSGETE